MPGVGLTVNGSRSWLGHGALRMQPAELAKLALLLFTADLLARRADRMGDVKATLRPVLVVLGVTGGLLMLQPNLGTTIVTVAIVFGMLFVAGTPLAPLGLATAVMAGAATFLTMSAPYRRARLLSFLHPWDDPLNTGYQTIQSLVGVASGGIAGVGLGASRAKWGFLPDAHTDFIFAIIGEELGLVGCSRRRGPLPRVRRPRPASGPPRARSLRHVGGHRHHGLGARAGVREHRRRRRRAAHHRRAAAVRVVRRVVAGRHPGGDRYPAEHRSPGEPRALTSPMSETFAVIAGGGTAGHVIPGLAVAGELVARGHAADTILWVGSERGLEATLVPPTGFPLHVLPGRGIQRRLTLANVGALLGSLRRRRPRVRPGAPPAAACRGRARRLRERRRAPSRPGRVGCRSS